MNDSLVFYKFYPSLTVTSDILPEYFRHTIKDPASAFAFLMKWVFIFEHIRILKQLPDFTSCRVFGTYLGFETITRIHINVNFPAHTLT